jgi:hypothetical protein
MDNQTIFDFERRVKPQDFSPPWLALKEVVPDSREWRLLSKYGAYCSLLGIDPQKAGEEVLARFLQALEDSGRTYGQNLVLEMRKLIERLRGDKGDLSLPPLIATTPRGAPRKEQWAALEQDLKDDISNFIDICGEASPSPSPSDDEEEAAKKSAGSKDEKKRFLLRMIDLAETGLKRPILRLRQLFENESLEAIEVLNYGAKPDLPWDHSTNAIHTRSRLLESGRRYAYEIIDDEELGDALDHYLHNAQKHQKRRASLAPRDREASRQLDAPETIRALVSACRQCMIDFGSNPNKRSYAVAQSALAIILLLATGRPPFKVRAATFSGPIRTMEAGDERATLALPDPTLVDLEGQIREETRVAIDAFWRGASKLWGPDRTKAFATSCGDVKSDSAQSIGVTKFSKSCNLKLGPKAIQVGVVRGLIAQNLTPQAIAEIIGVQQGISIKERFGSVIGANAPQRHADNLDQAGKLKK